MLTDREAIAAVRTKVFLGLRAGPERDPSTVLIRVTGTVTGEAAIPVPPSGQVVLPKIEDRLAWLVAWRGVEERAFDPPFVSDPGDDLVDFVVIVDAQTGEALSKLFMYGINRLS